ncbi:MAG TPA: TolC family protein, partial [Acidiphilium sp.]|nr:TolC family protein [Acidiphilium sp.]
MKSTVIPMRRRAGLATALLGTTLLAGCAVGPDYHQPAAPKLHDYTTTPLPHRTVSSSGKGGAAQDLVVGQKIAGAWWELFHSPQLDGLIRSALANNPSLKSAQDTLLAAQDSTRAAEGGFFPSVSGSFQAERLRSALGTTGVGSTGASATYTLRNASVAVSYAPDVFGATRRQVEGLRAQAEQQRFALEASYL